MNLVARVTNILYIGLIGLLRETFPPISLGFDIHIFNDTIGLRTQHVNGAKGTLGGSEG